MTRKTIARFAGIGAGAAMVLGFASPAGAVTVAELQAQLNALMAQLSALQGGGSTVTLTTDLTVGSSGSQVVTLQDLLVSQGYLNIPAGVAKGYFGGLTKAAVRAWQAANGLPSTGFFGPLSRARLSASNAPGTVTGGTTVGGTTGGGVITTPGIEGTITVSKNPSPASGAKVFEGSSKTPVLGIKLEAKTSDIRIERIKLDLDESSDSTTSDQDFYRKIASRLYIMDGSTVLASVDLNSSTVVEDGSDRFVTLSGLNYVVPRDATRVLTVAVDAMATWDTAFDGDSWTVGVPVEGVRGVDGAGVNQFGPSTAFSNDFTSQGELAESATLAVSAAASTPKATEVVASQGTSENELDGLELLKADFRAEKDSVTITDLVVDLTRGGNTSTATATTAYLFDGSTLIGSATVAGTSATAMTATFDDIDYVVPKDSTKTLSVKVDIDSAGTAATTFLADIDTADVTAENSAGTAITESGSATGETITVRSVGLEISLVSKSITKGLTPESGNQSTSTAEATFVIRVKAVGGDIVFGTAASTTVPFVSNAGGSHDDDPSFIIYRGGGEVTLDVASTSSVTVPSGVTNVTNNSFTLQENNTVDIPVSFLFEGRDDDSGAAVTTGSYAVGIQQLNWVSSAGIQASDFMDDKTDWRTATVSLP